MNRQALERLLIDRELGELPPDVAELLDAYLRQQPHETPVSNQIKQTVAVARQALEEPAETAAPPMPRLSAKLVLAAHAGPRRPLAWVRQVAVAAAIALAFFSGTQLAPELTGPAEPNLVAMPIGGSRPIEPPSDGFWSLRRLQEAAKARPRQSSAGLRWASPWTVNRIGERS